MITTADSYRWRFDSGSTAAPPRYCPQCGNLEHGSIACGAVNNPYMWYPYFQYTVYENPTVKEKEKQMETAVFIVQYKCGNCGKEFTEDYPKKWKVKQEWYGRVFAHTPNCKDACRRISCPTCTLDSEISVTNRSSIEVDVEKSKDE